MVVLFVETVGITEGLVPCGENAGCYAGPQEGTSVHLVVDSEARQVQDGWPKVDETDESVEPAAGFVVDEMAEVVGDANHQGDVETTLVGVSFAAGENSTVITEVKYESVLE